MVNKAATTPPTIKGMAMAWTIIDVGGRFIAARLQDSIGLLALEHQLQMGAVKAKRVANLVFQISLIGEVYQFRIIDCEKECGRVYANLLYPVYLDPQSTVFPDYWRRMACQGVGQHEL